MYCPNCKEEAFFYTNVSTGEEIWECPQTKYLLKETKTKRYPHFKWVENEIPNCEWKIIKKKRSVRNPKK